jgi:uncharacterized YkwD family protein
MFKKYLIAATISATVIFGGFQANTVDASASMGGDQQVEQKAPNYQKQDRQGYTHYNDLERLFGYFGKWNVSWDTKWDNRWYQETPQAEKPEVQKPVTPEKQETVEQEKPEAPKQEQPETNTPAPQPQQPAEPNTDNQSSVLNAFEQQVFELTNQERVKNGLPALKVDNELSKVAREKSRDIQAKNYFDHNSPTYGSPFDMMSAFGIDYRSAGENIAKGQRTPAEVVNAWMNSPGHRANILNNSFTHIGVGYVEQGNVWTQMFIGK